MCWNKKACVFFLLWMVLGACVYAQPRIVQPFNKDWKFLLADDSLASGENYKEVSWRRLSLPHDWSIESNFSSVYPAGNGGGALPGGVGWYRKTFMVPASFQNKLTRIEFDGVYKNSEVWVNGHWLGKRPYGYTNFSYDLTPYLHYDKPNVIAVRVDNRLQPDSRWYSGSGIYRDVQLVTTEKVAIAESGLFITTPEVHANAAIVQLQYKVANAGKTPQLVNVYTDVYDAAGKKVATSKTAVQRKVATDGAQYADRIEIKNPRLWSVSDPYLYKAITRIEMGGKLVDELKTPLGIRSFYFDSEKGFFLNNQALKIQGVCMHHDLGALGAAFNKAAAKRQLEILKNMGCNAIRFSHNPPAAAMLDLCDQMGFLVMVESFDMWKKKKKKYDYNLFFDQWHAADVSAMVLRDRNHPSVFMWSIGNEIPEQFDSSGTRIAAELSAIVKSIDPSRPVTSALTETFAEKNFITKSNALDVLNFNYKEYDYEALPQRFPGQKFVAGETASALETRGVYQMRSDSNRIWPTNFKVQDDFKGGNADFTCAAYDNTFAYWGATHEKAWVSVKKYPHMAGAFVWSGFDFLGEPVPYPWPARSSYYGIVDLAGFPKDVYYMYQSEWTNKPVLHVFPHWNWKAGDVVDVWAYYSQADEAELYLNDRSLGVQKKTDTSLHVMWRVPFAPGTVKVVTRKGGKQVLSKTISTTGPAAGIELVANKTGLKANGEDISFVTIRVVDSKGRLVPDADARVKCSVSGAGFLAGMDNGFQVDSVSLQHHERATWKGLLLVMIQSNGKKGNITVRVKMEGFPEQIITLNSL
ncbi:MAG TPA: glycoside hydrolase family 2 TIM barrel-domain containing protein [Phnomibacter sp.]|nr:glycoside hydrolase family 2 TIM barrel-domain containing protein [Phnomibacter sp.]